MRTLPEPSAADGRPLGTNRPETATDHDALRIGLVADVAVALTTADDRIEALGLDLAPIAGSA